jgi:hypothetical protein
MGSICSFSDEETIKTKYHKYCILLSLDDGHIKKIFSKHQKLCEPANRGLLMLNDWMKMFSNHPVRYVIRVFAIFEVMSGCLDCQGFLFAIWNYCTLSLDGMASFTYFLYTRTEKPSDSSRSIDLQQLFLDMKFVAASEEKRKYVLRIPLIF